MQVRIKEMRPLIKSVADSRLKWSLIGVGVLMIGVLAYGLSARKSAADEAMARSYVKPAALVQAAVPPEHVLQNNAKQDLAKVTVPDVKPVNSSITVPCMINGAQALCVPATNAMGSQPTYQPPQYIAPPLQSYAPVYQPPQVQQMQKTKSESAEERLERINADAQFAPAHHVVSVQTGKPAQTTSALDQIAAQINGLPMHTPLPPQSSSAITDDPNGQRNKLQFEKTDNAGDYNSAKRTVPVSRWVIEPGDTIPAILVHKVVSDLPGDLVGEVSKDVLDSPTHQYVLIPHGSLVVGSYSSMVSYAQGRVQEVWKYLRFPDGSYIDLDKFRGLSADGSSGLKDQTDNHLKRLIGGVLLSSIFAAGIQISQNHNGTNSTLAYPSTGQIASSAVGQQAGQLGEQITGRNLNVQPTLKIRPGEPFAIEVDKAILFDGPYAAVDWGK